MIFIRYSDIIPFYIKLNANCKEEEKSGTGPGSCGGNISETAIKSTATITERTLPNGKKYYSVVDSAGKIQAGNENRAKAERELEKIIRKEETKNKSSNLDSKQATDKSNTDKSDVNKSDLTASTDKILSYSDGLLSKCNKDQIESIKRYSTDSKEINHYLRTGKLYDDSLFNDKSEIENTINRIDSVFRKASLPKDMVVYRGINGHVLTELSGQFKEGSEFTLSSFTPTSYDKSIAEKFAQGENSALIEINLPKGSKAIAIENYTSDNKYKNEKEVAIKRNTKYRVKEVSKVGNRSHIILDALL